MARKQQPHPRSGKPVGIAAAAPVAADGETALARVFRLVLGVLFIWAALSKLANATDFLGTLYAYELPIPQAALKLLAVVLPWVELLAGLMLLAGWWPETALAIVAALLAAFLLATAQAWLRGLDIACGCFDLGFLGLDPEGALARGFESPAFAFLRNLGLAAMAAYLLRPWWQAFPARRTARSRPA